MNGTTDGATAVNGDHAPASRGPEMVRQGNRTIRAVIRTQGHQLVPFFCECSDADCGQALWLPLADYDDRTGAGGAILAAGHAC